MDQAQQDLATGQRVIRLEAEGLRALADGLDASFACAVDRLHRPGGRIVVSGMGKSGHVGRKIAATLASTGSPALFVHPAEAGHGDLGMVLAQDAVLALSNSGDTPELAALLAHTRRFGIPLVAITGRPDSLLGRAAEVVLALPNVAEACPIGLAPPPAPRCSWRLATPWPSRCWSGAASPRRISGSSTPAGGWARSSRGCGT